MSDSDGSSEECQEEKPVEEKPNGPFNRKDVPKRMRTRYWHSWEEMLFVELWRKHFDDVTCLDKNLPVFRKISAGMRDSGFHITGQEVQRKIKTIKNKYIAERRRLIESEDKNAKSEWRLYPLVHCLMTQSQKSSDPYQEEKALKTILERIGNDPLYHILLSGMPVLNTLEKVDAGESVTILPPANLENSFPMENKRIAECISLSYKNKHKRSFTPRSQRPSEIAAARAKMLTAELRTAFSIRNEAQSSQSASAFPLSNATIASQPVFSGRTLKFIATAESIKQLKLENKKLVEECVINRKRLKMEEQQFKAYESIIEQIQSQYQNLFKNLKVS